MNKPTKRKRIILDKSARAAGSGSDKESVLMAVEAVAGIKGARVVGTHRRITSASPVVTIEARRSLLNSNDSRTYLKAVNSTTAEVVAAIKLRISAEVSNSLADQSN